MGRNRKRGADERNARERDRTAPGLADDRLYRALAARPRRRLLFYLHDVEATTVDELATVLVGWDRPQQGGMATGEEYEQMGIALRHSHLPALADAGLVEYDADADSVRAVPLADSVADLVARSVASESG